MSSPRGTLKLPAIPQSSSSSTTKTASPVFSRADEIEISPIPEDEKVEKENEPLIPSRPAPAPPASARKFKKPAKKTMAPFEYLHKRRSCPGLFNHSNHHCIKPSPLKVTAVGAHSDSHDSTAVSDSQENPGTLRRSPRANS